jgi:hypothetical protein
VKRNARHRFIEDRLAEYNRLVATNFQLNGAATVIQR